MWRQWERASTPPMLLCCAGLVCGFETRYAKEVIDRFLNGVQMNYSLFTMDKTAEGNDQFKVDYEDFQLNITGSSPVALVRGFYEYIKRTNQGISSWSGNRLELNNNTTPMHFSKASPFRRHFYFNVVTYGYSMPYWDFERWQQEIDFMALHGLDFPLALVAQEAITRRMLLKFNVTQQNIDNYFAGPAHLPWMRMGNMAQLDGPLGDSWHEQQIALQHKILETIKNMGFEYVCPGFSGFVPKEISDQHPELDIIEMSWFGFHNWLLPADSQLYHDMAVTFMQEYEKEFGQCRYYLVDSFNEMSIPYQGEQRYEYLASYGEAVFQAINDANSNASWVIQGWTMGNDRGNWDKKTFAALLSRVPDDRMVVIDIAVDYCINYWKYGNDWDYYEKMYNKQWIYSVIPNMGGKTVQTGVLSFYANYHLQALSSPNKGDLIAHGTSPEALENNEILHELFLDAGWSSEEINLQEWFESYGRQRYGYYDDSWQNLFHGLNMTVYNHFTHQPLFYWQQRPSDRFNGNVFYNEEYFQVVEAFVDSIDNEKCGQSELCLQDVIAYVTFYLACKAEDLLHRRLDTPANSDERQAIETKFTQLLTGMDTLLLSSEYYRLDRWLHFVNKTQSAQLDQFYIDAKRLVTMWGGHGLGDYAAHLWSGLIKDYYLERWQNKFMVDRKGQQFDFENWETQWVNEYAAKEGQLGYGDIVAAARYLVGLVR